METFSVLLDFFAGNSLPEGLWHGALRFSLICTWTDSWANNGDAGDLRRCRAHYDVIVLIQYWYFYITVHAYHYKQTFIWSRIASTLGLSCHAEITITERCSADMMYKYNIFGCNCDDNDNNGMKNNSDNDDNNDNNHGNNNIITMAMIKKDKNDNRM